MQVRTARIHSQSEYIWECLSFDNKSHLSLCFPYRSVRTEYDIVCALTCKHLLNMRRRKNRRHRMACNASKFANAKQCISGTAIEHNGNSYPSKRITFLCTHTKFKVKSCKSNKKLINFDCSGALRSIHGCLHNFSRQFTFKLQQPSRRSILNVLSGVQQSERAHTAI